MKKTSEQKNQHHGKEMAVHQLKTISIIEKEHAIEIVQDKNTVSIFTISDIDALIDILKYAKHAHYKKKLFVLQD
jgi:hypothetical protein